jgi:hypothetical protein
MSLPSRSLEERRRRRRRRRTKRWREGWRRGWCLAGWARWVECLPPLLLE